MSTTFDKRIFEYIKIGNVEMIANLLEMQFLKPYDYLYIDSHNTNPEDGMSLFMLIARHPCKNYKEMIDTLLRYGADINDAIAGDTALETAIIYKNFPTAAYLQHRGATYDMNLIGQYNTISDINLFDELDKEMQKINDPTLS